ncbi:leucine-rich repeat domain-containing protein, partial [Candidatus Poribacteria bacterium]|nr:leucine-rich repeat domain-containing protein [Candidatus Poribacteria bacterium]
PLQALTKLEYLHLQENEIQDISVIENFKNLHLLRIKGNPVQDMTPIDRYRKRVPNFRLGTEIDP